MRFLPDIVQIMVIVPCKFYANIFLCFYSLKIRSLFYFAIVIAQGDLKRKQLKKKIVLKIKQHFKLKLYMSVLLQIDVAGKLFKLSQ